MVLNNSQAAVSLRATSLYRARAFQVVSTPENERESTRSLCRGPGENIKRKLDFHDSFETYRWIYENLYRLRGYVFVSAWKINSLEIYDSTYGDYLHIDGIFTLHRWFIRHSLENVICIILIETWKASERVPEGGKQRTWWIKLKLTFVRLSKIWCM